MQKECKKNTFYVRQAFRVNNDFACDDLGCSRGNKMFETMRVADG